MVTAQLKMAGDKLTVHLRVENAEAYRHLAADRQVMEKALRAQGFNVDQITLRHKRYDNVYGVGDVINAPNAKIYRIGLLKPKQILTN